MVQCNFSWKRTYITMFQCIIFIFMTVLDGSFSHPPVYQPQFLSYGYGSIPAQRYSATTGYAYNVRIPAGYSNVGYVQYPMAQFGYNNWRKNHNHSPPGHNYPPGYGYGHGRGHGNAYKKYNHYGHGHGYGYGHGHGHGHHFHPEDDNFPPATSVEEGDDLSTEQQSEEHDSVLNKTVTTTSSPDTSTKGNMESEELPEGDPFAIDLRFASGTKVVANATNATSSQEDREKRSTNSIEVEILSTQPTVRGRSFNAVHQFYPSFFWHGPNFHPTSTEDDTYEDNSLATCVQSRYECLPMTQCTDTVEQSNSQRQRRFCRRGHGGEPYICCRKQNLSNRIGPSFTRQDVACGRKIPISGGARTAAVLGGSPVAGASSYPWMAAIGQIGSSDGANGGIDWFCGGALISQQTALTAAHCLMRRRADLVRVGETDLTKRGSSTVQVVRVWRTHSHPSHRAPTMYNDLALIYLSKPVLLNQHVRPVCLPRSPIGKAVAILTGWGQTNFEGERSNVLQEVTVQVFNNSACDKMYGASGVAIQRSFPRGILDTQMCAGHEEGGRDACQGDSGSPLVTEEESNFVLSGIVSAGIGCGSKSFPGIYTRVTSYVPWILENLI